MTTRLPIRLEELRIASPCGADWDQMVGDERVRFCGRCERNVYNLSAMTRVEAEALVRAREGRLCVRLYRRQDGTVITADCPVGLRRQKRRQRLWASLSAAAASLALLAGVLSGRARGDLTVRGGKKAGVRSAVTVTGGAVAPPPKPVMGKPAPPPPKPPKPEMGEPLMGDIAP